MGLFDWFKTKQTADNNDVLKTNIPRPVYKDWTNNMSANISLTRNLYHNTYPGMKLAGGLAFPPIAIPVNFMGIPVPKPADSTDEKTKEELDDLVLQFSDLMKQIHTFCSVDGTVWIWPFYSRKADRLIWEFIDDDSISTIVKDIETGDIIKIISEEEIMFTVDYEKDVFLKRRRTFTPQEITFEYYGTDVVIPQELKSVRVRNPFNVIPIPFANNPDPRQKRGHSDYERIITDLKDYHNIDLARSEMLAKFKPKMMVAANNPTEWLENQLKANNWSATSEFDIAAIDLIINKNNGVTPESLQILWLDSANAPYAETLEQKFMKIVEASGTPEIVWGLKTKNNSNSAEVSLDGLIKFVHGKQDQITKAYHYLISTSLKIKRFMRFDQAVPEIEIEWNDLDAVSDEVRAKIFKNFAEGMSKLISVAGITKEQVFKMFEQMYPTATEDDFEDFKKGLTDMANHVQYTKADFTMTRDLNGMTSDTDDDLPEDIPPEPDNLFTE